ncbi:MAG: two-component system, NarL family, sensor histidine kinase BarA [Parcubacteria bacterium C7867-006]|nr:MAG: two-component system, NarL family, sensor histidine kinase BarA [Parcubacteria bacterium C7867-006]
MSYKTEWDLTLLYKNENDPKIEKEIRAVEKATKAFEKKYISKNFTSSAKSLLEALKDSEKLGEIFGKSFDLMKATQDSVEKKVVFETGGVVLGSKFLRVIVAPILITQDTSEEIIGYVLLIEDITEAKVVERSREEFFAIASHELRTPLTAIRGNMEMLQDFWTKLKDAEKKEMIGDAVLGSKRLLSIVNDFLDISRLEQGKIPLHKEPVDIIDTIEKSLREMKVLSDSKKIKIIFKKPNDLALSIRADEERVKQILINLINNALTHTEKGTITLSVEKTEQTVSVSVTDTGTGIPPENQTLLFRKFQQASSAVLSREATKGTGLGLYISKLLVEQMGGTIELVKSVPNEGSTFRFSLPLSSSPTTTIPS